MYSEKLKQTKDSIDQKKLTVVSDLNTEVKLSELIEKYGIHVDASGEVFSATMLLCFGLINSQECFGVIKNIKAVPEEEFSKLIEDINTQIVDPIKNKLKNDSLLESESIQKNYDTKLIDPLDDSVDENLQAAILQKRVMDANENTLDAANKAETAEETLARIDKEVEEEIEAKIVEELRKKESEKLDEQKNMARVQNKITVDLNLDNIPKTHANTYLHSQKPVEPEKGLGLGQLTNSKESISFIESVAHGEITSKTESATTTQQAQNYIRDPYKEEI